MEPHSFEQDGYILLQNKLTMDELQAGLVCVKYDKVDYSRMKLFIDTIFLPAIQRSFGEVISQPKYVKFRFSDNNNSTDASTFHGDIYNHTKNSIVPIYTCLCYFDDAQLEVIPGSHISDKKGISIQTFNKRRVLHVKRGDILIFHSNMHHRGINYNKEGNRRLLQVFEVFPDIKTYDEYAPDLITIETADSPLVKNIIGPLLYQVSKVPTLIDCFTFFHYIIVCNDMQYKIGMMDLPPWEKANKYITYEPSKRFDIELISNQTNELNVNVICDKTIYSRSYSNFYMYVYILYWVLTIILGVLLFSIMNKLRKNKYIFKKMRTLFSKK
jgi:hypothetical protein